MNDLHTELAELRNYVAYLKADRDAIKAKENSEKWTKWVSLTIVFLAVGAALANQQYGGFSGAGVRALNNAAIAQGNATNKWSYYQSVSIKLHMYKFEKRRDKADKKAAAVLSGSAVTALAASPVGSAPVVAAVATGSPPVAAPAAIAVLGEKKEKKEKKEKGDAVGKDGKKSKKPKKKETLDDKIAKYSDQKPKIMAEARAFEKDVDTFRDESASAQKHTKELTLALAVLQVAIAVGSISALAKKKPLWFVAMAIGAYGIFQTFNGIMLWIA